MQRNSNLKILFLLGTFSLPLQFMELNSTIISRIFNDDCPFNDVDGPRGVFKRLKQVCSFYFKGTNDAQWNSRKLGDPATAKAVLGYDLSLEYIYETTTQDTTTTLYLHGWGDTKNSARLLKKFCKVLDDNVATFNFSDARPVFGKLKQSSFGQLSDVLSALYAAHRTIKELKLTALNLFGISRGGATIINMLALLNNDDLFAQHKAALAKIGIDENARVEILNAIQNGTIILDVPLRSMKYTPFPRFVAQKFTTYDPNGLQALETVKLLEGLKLTMLVHFQHADWIVSNKGEAAFFFHLARNNPASTYLVMGHDGGHLHTHAALSKAVALFKKPVSTNEGDDKLIVSTVSDKSGSIKNAVLINFANPTLDGIKTALHDYHRHESAKSFFGRIKNWFSK